MMKMIKVKKAVAAKITGALLLAATVLAGIMPVPVFAQSKEAVSARKNVRMNPSMRSVRFVFMTITSVRVKKQSPLKKITVHLHRMEI